MACVRRWLRDTRKVAFLGYSFACCLFMMAPSNALAQEAPGSKDAAATQPPPSDTGGSKLSLSLVGQVNVSTNFDHVYASLGGPNVKLSLSGMFLGLSFYPSLRLAPDTVVPALGAGPFAGYKFIQIVMPFYVIEGVLKPTLGLGVIFP